jgi:4-amino-4-deoxy-L-arabinose transferase-like glycosyltransferase
MKNRDYILSLIIFVHVMLVVISMNQPFHGDEALLAETGKQILKTGVPILSYGANNPNYEVLLHIPFHVYLLSGFIYLFGWNIYSVRALSALFNMLTVLLTYLIVKEILKDNPNKETWALIAAFIYAFNPFVIQSSIWIDNDGGLLNFSIYLFFYFFIKNKKFYYLIPSLVFVMLSKEFGGPILFITLMVFYMITGDIKKIPKTILLFFISGTLWISSWYIFAKAMNLNFMKPILFNFGMFFSFGGEGSPLNPLAIIIRIWNFKTFFYFAVPFFVSLFFILSFIFYIRIIKEREGIKNEKTKKVLLFNIFPFLVMFVYLFMGGSGWGFPKYHTIAVSAMCIFICYMLSKEDLDEKIKTLIEKNWFIILCAIILLGVYMLKFIRSPLMPEFDSTGKNTNITGALFLIIKSFSLYVIVPFVFLIIIGFVLKIKRKIIISLILLSIFMFFYINFLHVAVDYSTYSKYGDRGIPEVISYIKEKQIPSSQIATQSHIGSYIGFSQYTEISFVYDNSETFKKEIVDNKEINYIIIWERDIGRIGDNMKYFNLESKIGTYYIFRKNQGFSKLDSIK